MADKPDYSHLPVVTDWVPTADGEGRLFKLVSGKRLVLEKGAQWEPEDDRTCTARDQLCRVSISQAELDRQERAAWRVTIRMAGP